jgi:ElaB/YqjD/DUF883 family membrane-anchored ribosome-binding protein
MTAHEANQRLVSDLKLVMRDAEDLFDATKDAAGEKVNEVRNRLAKALASGKATCELAQEKAGQAAKATDEIIRHHPYETIGVAFGAGLLIGALAGRR